MPTAPVEQTTVAASFTHDVPVANLIHVNTPLHVMSLQDTTEGVNSRTDG
jgi:hypothetical protein